MNERKAVKMDEAYGDLSDVELREALELPEGQEGLRYYMPKADKVAWLEGRLDDVGREDALARAKARQQEHHAYLRRRRREGSPDRAAMVEQALAGQAWRYRGTRVAPSGFKDTITGRRAKIGHLIEGVASGHVHTVTRSTLVEAHERLGLVIGWPPRGRQASAPEAATAGLATGAGLRSGVGPLRGRE